MTDFTIPRRRYNLAQSILGQAIQPTRNAGAGEGIARILAAYFASKGMRGAERQETEMREDKDRSRRMETQSLVDAYTGMTPGQNARENTFVQPQQNPQALMQAMMGSSNPQIQMGGLSAALSAPGGEMPGFGKYNPGDYTPASWTQFMQTRNPKVLQRYEPYQVVNVNGVPTLVNRSDLAAEQTPTPLSTIEEESGAAAALAGAKEEAMQQQKLLWGPQIAEAVKLAEAEAKERGEVLTDLARAEAALPGLEQTVAELKELAEIATYTLGGRAFDAIVRETGFGATEGATARAKFINIINNQVLPMLKPTFGGAFSIQEGESLKATMGDKDLSPAEKIAQLDAFIQQKYRDIQTKQAQIGGAPTTDESDEGQGNDSPLTSEEREELERLREKYLK